MMNEAGQKERDADFAVVIRGVEKSFNGKPVHNGVDLSVRNGEIITLVGGSGDGKSVLLKQIIGLMKPDRGEIFVRGREITSMSEFALHKAMREVGMVFQGSALFDSLSVRENIAYGVRERDPRISERAVSAIVEEKLTLVDLPGIESVMPTDLSGGMRKRVAIARALAPEPSIILYDEPTVGLDPANVRRINKVIVKLRDTVGVTSIVVTHNMGAVEAITDRLALLERGKIIAVGTWDEVAGSSSPTVRHFFEGEIDEVEPSFSEVKNPNAT